MNISLEGTKLEVTKHMIADPRRVGKIEIAMHLPGANLTDKDKLILERSGNNCPVHKSLHPDVEKDIHYTWL